MNSQWVVTLMGWAQSASDIALGWLLSPAAWSQFILLALAYLLARAGAKRLGPLLTRLLEPGQKTVCLPNCAAFRLASCHC